ncbi:hypothetical protein AGLY_009329 [Aphis glycines]|uniref:Uncharacterized protein n=1 Tax=Aphis glycines TaxID=307491 RepID=A0A6G0TI18_APHGL|nr:hypothetical protein AGLY_009329 [Aphis glycines]
MTLKCLIDGCNFRGGDLGTSLIIHWDYLVIYVNRSKDSDVDYGRSVLWKDTATIDIWICNLTMLYYNGSAPHYFPIEHCRDISPHIFTILWGPRAGLNLFEGHISFYISLQIVHSPNYLKLTFYDLFECVEHIGLGCSNDCYIPDIYKAAFSFAHGQVGTARLIYDLYFLNNNKYRKSFENKSLLLHDYLSMNNSKKKKLKYFENLTVQDLYCSRIEEHFHMFTLIFIRLPIENQKLLYRLYKNHEMAYYCILSTISLNNDRLRLAIYTVHMYHKFKSDACTIFLRFKMVNENV